MLSWSSQLYKVSQLKIPAGRLEMPNCSEDPETCLAFGSCLQPIEVSRYSVTLWYGFPKSLRDQVYDTIESARREHRYIRQENFEKLKGIGPTRLEQLKRYLCLAKSSDTPYLFEN